MSEWQGHLLSCQVTAKNIAHQGFQRYFGHGDDDDKQTTRWTLCKSARWPCHHKFLVFLKSPSYQIYPATVLVQSQSQSELSSKKLRVTSQLGWYGCGGVCLTIWDFLFGMEPVDKQVKSNPSIPLTLDENANLAAALPLRVCSTFHILCIFWEASEDNGGTSGGGG